MEYVLVHIMFTGARERVQTGSAGGNEFRSKAGSHCSSCSIAIARRRMKMNVVAWSGLIRFWPLTLLRLVSQKFDRTGSMGPQSVSRKDHVGLRG